MTLTMLLACAGMKQAAVEDAMVAVWNRGEVERIEAAYAPELQNGAKEFVAEYRAVYPDLSVTIDDVIVKGDRIVTLWTVEGTHKDLGLPVTVSGVSVRTLDGRTIVEEQRFYDMKNVYDQLGFRLVPPDGATPFGPLPPEPEATEEVAPVDAEAEVEEAGAEEASAGEAVNAD